MYNIKWSAVLSDDLRKFYWEVPIFMEERWKWS